MRKTKQMVLCKNGRKYVETAEEKMFGGKMFTGKLPHKKRHQVKSRNGFQGNVGGKMASKEKASG